jgi:phosphoglucosamine mutase
MKLTLDLANGANYIIAKNTFEKAGYKITSYNDNPNGKNINDKCGSTYLENLPAQINKDGSEYGISMDGDGDRIAIIDKIIIFMMEMIYFIQLLEGKKLITKRSLV